MNNLSADFFEAKTPAKINLFLRILGKRPDSYHNIYTLFIPISIYDRIKLTKSEDLKLNCNDSSIPTDESNIILKTDKILRAEYGLKDNFLIELDKSIPSGAGLGGGSSDAACYLKLINSACGLGLSCSNMFDIMLRVGSDTAFFIEALPAFAEGRGEVLTRCKVLPEMFFIIVNPKVHISTKSIYESRELVYSDFNKVKVSEGDLSEFGGLKKIMVNDMQAVVSGICPEVKNLVEDMADKFNGLSLMSGSGSTVFSVYNSFADRDVAFDYFYKKYPDYLVAKADVAI